ncbi:MAG: hypothetical protein ACRCUH_15060 [Shewanella sp.]
MCTGRGRPPLPVNVSKTADHKVFITEPEKKIVLMMPEILGKSGSEFFHESFTKNLRETLSSNPDLKLEIIKELKKHGLELPMYLRG